MMENSLRPLTENVSTTSMKSRDRHNSRSQRVTSAYCWDTLQPYALPLLSKLNKLLTYFPRGRPTLQALAEVLNDRTIEGIGLEGILKGHLV